MGRIRPHLHLPLTALLALGAGVVLYLLTRDPASVYFITLLPRSLWPDGVISCTACGSLPSLLHVYAFILISAYVLQPVTGRQLVTLCLGWFSIEILFEIGQIDSVATLIQPHLPSWSEQLPLASIMDNFLLRGTFDPMDILFTALGTLAAYGLLIGRLSGEMKDDPTKRHKQLPV
ncbi:MAG: hypothetical protein P8171_17690 [Candidatus Thiodiazotropha sp.]